MHLCSAARNSVQTLSELIILINKPGKTLLQWLQAYYSGVSLQKIEARILKGEFLLGDEVLKNPNQLLSVGTRICWNGKSALKTELSPSGKLPFIIYEDEDLLVVLKPSGQAVHPGLGVFENTLLNDVCTYYKKKEINFNPANALVHRLDKGTSGLMVLAKNKSSADVLQNAFKERNMQKSYLAICKPNFELENEFTIKSNIGRIPGDDFKIGISEDGSFGKPAITNITLKEKNKKYFVVACKPITGRTHQLRIHLSSVGLPILNDLRYGGMPIPELDVNKFFLFANALSFNHPKIEKTLNFDINLSYLLTFNNIEMP